MENYYNTELEYIGIHKKVYEKKMLLHRTSTIHFNFCNVKSIKCLWF